MPETTSPTPAGTDRVGDVSGTHEFPARGPRRTKPNCPLRLRSTTFPKPSALAPAAGRSAQAYEGTGELLALVINLEGAEQRIRRK
jgi:hypothetical protein